jgi:hypothetical protein
LERARKSDRTGPPNTVLTHAFQAVPHYLDISVVPKAQIAPVVISLTAPEKWSPVFWTNGGRRRT